MYGNLTDWRAHALARGNSAPTEANDAEALAALQRASDYIQYRYVAILAQGYDETLSVVEPATYEAARLELATPGLFTKTFTQSEQKVLTGVDSIRWTVTGKADGTHSAMPVSTLIHAMFEPYVNDPDDMNFGLRAVGG
ncbi:hypothetical protein [Litorimonas haliclonae]|uniref:hypothetical protein n=1 Tax=Litorimonas haliclonae TaxID=2081977 RepID=UPI0039EF7504